MYTPPVRRRQKPYRRKRSRRRSIVPDLPLQPPVETPPPVLMRGAIEAAWRTELASTMAELYPPVTDDGPPTEMTRPMRNAPRGTLPARPESEPPAPEPVQAVEPIVNLRPRTASAGLALAAIGIVAVLVGAGVAFFMDDVDVDVNVAVAAPDEPADTPEPIVTPLPEQNSQTGGAIELAQPEKPANKRQSAKPKAKRKRPKAKPTPMRERIVETAVEEPGFFTIDAHPYATVYIDNDRVGDTPLIRHSLAAGKHQVKLVSSNGNTKRFVIRIKPGTTLRRRVGAME